MVGFAMTTYQDGELAKKSIRALREFYPKSPVVLCSDEDERLKLPELCGAWTERWMKGCMKTDADIIVKLDPDTRAYNRVSEWPESDVFGVWAPIGVYAALGAPHTIYGAAIGFQRHGVKRILDSGLLRDSKYKKFAWEGVSIQDPIVTDIVKTLGLSVSPWSGLHIRTKWDGLGEFDKKKVAFAHPVRD